MGRHGTPEGRVEQQVAAHGDDREGPHVGVLQNLQLPFPALVGAAGVCYVQEAVQMDAAGDEQRQQRRHGGKEQAADLQPTGQLHHNSSAPPTTRPIQGKKQKA